MGEVEIRQIRHNAHVISYKVFNALEYGVYLGSSGVLREQIDTAFSVATDTAQRH